MTRLRPSRIFAVLTAVLTALGLVLLTAQPAAGGTREAAALYSLANEERAEHGLAPLDRNTAMDAVAGVWATALSVSGVLGHNPSFSEEIPGGWTAVAENVAEGQPTPQAMHDAWMRSPGHAANILGDYTDVGLAFIDAGGTTWGVAVFAAYPAPGSKPAPTAPPTAPPASPSPDPSPSKSGSPERSDPPPARGGTDAGGRASTGSGGEAGPDSEPADEATDPAEPVETAEVELGTRPVSPVDSVVVPDDRDSTAGSASQAKGREDWGDALPVGIGTATLATMGVGAVLFLRFRHGGRHRADVPVWRAWLGPR